MSIEAIKHYEAALKEAFPSGATGDVFHHWNEARKIIANEALDRMAENARELGLDYEPVIDESAAKRIATALGWKPAAQWVGLTDDEIEECFVITPDQFLKRHIYKIGRAHV